VELLQNTQPLPSYK
jgi:glutamine amidotransferase